MKRKFLEFIKKEGTKMKRTFLYSNLENCIVFFFITHRVDIEENIIIKKLAVLVIIFTILFSGCSAPILFIPNAINKQENIRVEVLPVKDLTNQYLSSIEMEKMIKKCIRSEFKGVRLNEFSRTEVPRYEKIPNPFMTVYSEQEKSDIKIQTTIEQLYYGPLNKSVLASYLAFGLIGAAIASRDNSKVIGLLAVRVELINASTGDALMVRYVTGKSQRDYPDQLLRETALKQAAKEVAIQIAEIFSKPNDSSDAKRYYLIQRKKDVSQ